MAEGYGSKLNHQKTAGVSPCFHLPGSYFGYLFFTHSQKSRIGPKTPGNLAKTTQRRSEAELEALKKDPNIPGIYYLEHWEFGNGQDAGLVVSQVLAKERSNHPKAE